jgi:hypothetical protein
MKELTESVSVANFRMKFEAGRSFDLEDDMEFCPGLLTESDVSAKRIRSRLNAAETNVPHGVISSALT